MPWTAWMRSVVVGVVAATSATPAFGQAASDSPPPASTEPFTKVTADLAARSFGRVLPFDVPFFIVGTAPAGTVRLEVQYRESRVRDGFASTPWQPEVPAE